MALSDPVDCSCGVFGLSGGRLLTGKTLKSTAVTPNLDLPFRTCEPVMRRAIWSDPYPLRGPHGHTVVRLGTRQRWRALVACAHPRAGLSSPVSRCHPGPKPARVRQSLPGWRIRQCGRSERHCSPPGALRRSQRDDRQSAARGWKTTAESWRRGSIIVGSGPVFLQYRGR